MKSIITTLDTMTRGCPSEWQLYTADPDEQYYVRYRFGILQCDRLTGGNRDDRTVLIKRVGDPMAGIMDTQTMIQHVSEILDFSVVESYAHN